MHSRLLMVISIVLTGVCFPIIGISCSSSQKKSHSRVNSAFFVSPETVGIVVTHYSGGDGTPLSGDEHASDYHMHYYLYSTTSKSAVEQPGFSPGYDGYGADAYCAESLFIITGYSNQGFPCFSSRDGGLRATIPASPELPSAEMKTVSPNGRYFFIYSYNDGQQAQVYDMQNRAYSTPQAFSNTSMFKLENDGVRFFTIAENGDAKWLVRQRLDTGAQDTVGNIAGYSYRSFTAPRWMLFTDANDSVFYAVTDQTSGSPLRPLHIKGSIVDLDTVTGNYLTHSPNESGVSMGNYQTGAVPARIFADY